MVLLLEMDRKREEKKQCNLERKVEFFLLFLLLTWASKYFVAQMRNKPAMNR